MGREVVSLDGERYDSALPNEVLRLCQGAATSLAPIGSHLAHGWTNAFAEGGLSTPLHKVLWAKAVRVLLIGARFGNIPKDVLWNMPPKILTPRGKFWGHRKID
jgi:hypothetical protein